MQSCKKSDTSVPVQSSTFALKNESNQIYQYLDPNVLISIHSNLLKSGRISDAAQVYAQYDTTTGFLKSMGKQEPVISLYKNTPIDSSKIISLTDTIPQVKLKSAWNPTGVYGEGWVQAHYWVGLGYKWFDGAGTGYQYSTNTGAPAKNGAYVGTVGLALRLEAYKLYSSILQYPISYSICQRYIAPGYAIWTWYDNIPNGAYNGWNQQMGTTGLSAPTCQIKMAFANTPNFHIFYTTHMAGSGWQTTWSSDGQTSGVFGVRLEAFAYIIVQF